MITILRDEPSDEDKFRSGSSTHGPHERIATAIENRIVSEEGGGAIGLEGEYGSGKSTIIRLLENRLKNRDDADDICFVVFDAWAHEGDPLRRAFLETLINELLERPDWLPKEKWIEKKEQLSQRHRKIKESRTTRPSTFGIWMAFATACVPLGLLLTRLVATKENFDLDPGLEIAWLVLVGIVLASMPLIVPLFRLLERADKVRLYKKYHQDGPEKTAKFRKRRNKLYAKWSEAPRRYRDVLSAEHFNFLAANATLDSESDAYESPDPTSIEFERDFRDLLEDSLTPPAHKIVLVVDNLDRLTAEQSLRVWSNLQAFVGHPELNGERWKSKFTLLVPYTPTAIQEIWKKTRSVTNAESFFEKTFQIRYRTPPPTLSNWRENLRRMLIDAIPDMPPGERKRVIEVFDLVRLERPGRIVPRQLKLRVNQLAILFEMWSGDGLEIPSRSLAYAVLHGVPPGEIEDCLRSGLRHPNATEDKDKKAFPSEGAIAVCGKDLIEHLAAVHFNVEQAEAIQLLMDNAIEEALMAGQPDKLIALRDRHEERFWITVQSTVRSHAKTQAAEGLSTWSRGLQLLTGSDLPEEAATVREYIRKRMQSITDAWAPLKKETIAGLVNWVELDPSEEMRTAVIKIAERTLVSSKKELDLDARMQLAAAMDSAGLKPSTGTTWTVRMEGEEWFDKASTKARNETGDIFIEPKCTSKDLLEVMCQRIACSGQTPDTCTLTEEDIEAFAILKTLRDRLEASEVVEELATKVAANAGTQSAEAVDAISTCLTLLHALKQTGEVAAQTRLNNNDFLRLVWGGLTHAIALNRDAHPILITLIATEDKKDFAKDFKAVPQETRTYLQNLMENGDLVITEPLWGLVRKYGIKEIVGRLAGRSSNGFSLDMVEHAHADDGLIWAMPDWHFSINAGWLKSGLESRQTSFADVVACLAGDESQVDALLSKFDVQNAKHRIAATAFMDHANDPVQKRVVAKTKSAIKGLTKEDWVSDFADGFEITAITHRLLTELEITAVDTNFGTAVQSMVSEMAKDGRAVDDDELAMLAGLVSELPSTVRKELGTQSVGLLRANDKGMSEPLAELVGSAISESAATLEADDVANLVSRTLAKDGTKSLSWCVEWIGRYEADDMSFSPAAEDLLQRQLLASEAQSDDEATLRNLQTIREKLGVAAPVEEDTEATEARPNEE